jgi:hypothetical protein
MSTSRTPDGAARITTYDDLDRFVRAFADGVFNFLILVGDPGLQKSRVVRDAMPDACWIEGHATPLGIYMRLWERRNDPVIIDDVDSLYGDKAAVRLLKGLCQTERHKVVAWETSARVLEREDIPRRFTTSSPVMIIANVWRSLNVNVQAIEDRGHLLHFVPTPLEVHRRTATWFWDQQIYDWIGARLHLVPRPSMRMYLAAWELKKAVMDWRGWILNRWLEGPRLLVARLQADPSFATEEDRVKAFVEQGGGCRATYFRHAKLLKPAGEPPHIALAHSAPPPDDPSAIDVMDILRRRHGYLGNG